MNLWALIFSPQIHLWGMIYGEFINNTHTFSIILLSESLIDTDFTDFTDFFLVICVIRLIRDSDSFYGPGTSPLTLFPLLIINIFKSSVFTLLELLKSPARISHELPI